MASVVESDRFVDDGNSSSESKALLAIATKDLFRNNAFRITGLPVDASARDLAKHADKLKVLAELGQDTDPTAAFPLRPAATLEQIRNAIQKLKDPEKRLIDEFFWFWPQRFGESQADPAIEALQRGDLQTAADTWMSRRKNSDEGITAQHNLALVYHIEALDWENHCLRHDVDAKRRAEITEYWKAAFYRWNQVLTKEQLWETVARRIRQLKEPSLTTGSVRRMRASVPDALVKINAELAVAFAEVGKVELARTHVALMDATADAAAHVGKIAEQVLMPVRKRLHEHIRNAKDGGDKDPTESLSAARELLEHVRGTLSLFDLFGSKTAHLRNDAFDEVAETCNRLQVTYHKATNDNAACLEFLETVLPYAASTELREQIAKNIQTLKENIAGLARDKQFYANLRPISSPPSLRTINGIGFTLYGSTDVDSATGSYLTTYYFCFFFVPLFPICRYRVIRSGNSYRFLGKAPLRTGDKWHLAIALGLIGLFFLSAAISGSSQSSTPGRASTYATPSYATGSRSYIPSNPATPQPTTRPDDWDNERQQMRTRALASEKAEIEAERPTIQALEEQVENLAREIERDRSSVDTTNEYEVDAFNARLRRYRALLQEAKNAEAAFNRKVDSYNAKLRGSSEPSASTPPAYAPNGSGYSGTSQTTPTPQQSVGRATAPASSPTPAQMVRLLRPVRVRVNDHDVVLKAGLTLRVLSRSGRDVVVYYDYAAVTIPASSTAQVATEAPSPAGPNFMPNANAAPTPTATAATVDAAVSTPNTRPVGTIRIASSETLNVRATASADSPIVGKLHSGDHVYVETERVVNAGKGVPVTWQKITSFAGYQGWVNAQYISASD